MGSLDQRMAALDRANYIREMRAILRAGIAQGMVDPVAILEDPPEVWRSATIRFLLVSVPGIGPTKTEAICKAAQVSTHRRLYDLSDPERARLVVGTRASLETLQASRERPQRRRNRRGVAA